MEDLIQVISEFLQKLGDAEWILEMIGLQIMTAAIIIIPVMIFTTIKNGKANTLGIQKRSYIKSRIFEVDKMSGIEFENYLALYFQGEGYDVEMTPAKGDFGADLILRKDGQKIAVQAKRHNSYISLTAVQEVFTSLAYYGANRGIVITNNYFSKPAIELAKCNSVELWDRETLIQKVTKENLEELREQNERFKMESLTKLCPRCQKGVLIKKTGRFGKFIGCDRYPRCTYTTNLRKHRF